MSTMPRFIPDSECVQSKCANATTGCQGVCMMRNPGWVVAAPAEQAAPDSAMLKWALRELLTTLPKSRDWFNPDAEKVLRATLSAPLPAAPAPTRNTTFGLDDNGKQVLNNAAPAPTEQQDELPITRSTYGSLEACEAEQARRNAARNERAPTEDEFAKMMSDVNVTHIACMMGNMIYNLSQKKGRTLTAADCEMFNNLREQWDAARQAPDSRDAGIELVAVLIDKKVANYDSDFGATDPDTGTREYPGNGIEWVGQMGELAEEIRSLKFSAATVPSAE